MPAVAVPPAPPVFSPVRVSARIEELDILRGFLLLWMTLTHLPTHVSVYSNQVVGYVSAAEGFIFMAALLTGQIHRGQTGKYGAATASRNVFRRAWRIYRFHAALLVIAFTLGAWVAIHLGRIPLANLLDYYLLHPRAAAAAALALLYDPPLLDILPMYVLFMLLTPPLLWVAKRFGWRAVVAGSAAVWLLAQFHLRAHFYAALNAHGFQIPVNQAGAFDLFAWQLLWVFGLWVGSAVSRQRLADLRFSRTLVTASVAIAAVFFVCRHVPVNFGALVDKWQLGLLRQINFAAVAILLLRFGPALARIPGVAALAPLGRSSLEVFSAHVLCCLVALGLSAAPDPAFPWWEQALVLAATLAVLFKVGYRADRKRSRQKPATLQPAAFLRPRAV